MSSQGRSIDRGAAIGNRTPHLGRTLEADAEESNKGCIELHAQVASLRNCSKVKMIYPFVSVLAV